VLRVGGDAVADELGVDPRPASRGVPELFEHEHGPGLAHDEAIAIGVERPARVLRVVVATREGAQRGEAGDSDPRDRRLAATYKHDVGAAEADRVEAVADRHRRGGAASPTTRAKLLGDGSSVQRLAHCRLSSRNGHSFNLRRRSRRRQ
jgi:hypothetical protein